MEILSYTPAEHFHGKTANWPVRQSLDSPATFFTFLLNSKISDALCKCINMLLDIFSSTTFSMRGRIPNLHQDLKSYSAEGEYSICYILTVNLELGYAL